MTQVNIRVHLDEFTTTDELVLHRFGAVCGKRDIFVLQSENVVPIKLLYILMESNQDTTALVQQV